MATLDSNDKHDNHTPEAAGEFVSLRDHFLIAMPGLQDPIFSRSLTYICDHTAQGAMGIVVNQPMNLTLGDIFEQLELQDKAQQAGRAVLAGGPVNTERGFVLHRDSGAWESTMHIAPDVNLTASRDIVHAIANNTGPKSSLFALGYAGWSAGQLEEEISANSWLTIPADSSIIFDIPVEDRWAAAARQLGIDIHLMSATAGHA